MKKQATKSPRLTLEGIRALDDGRFHGPTCGIATFAAALTADERATLRTAFDDRTIAATAIHKALVALGLKLGIEATQKHRRRSCGTCFRDGGFLA